MFQFEATREAMLKIADDYERLARNAERAEESREIP
jgi:hypothetical protein